MSETTWDDIERARQPLNLISAIAGTPPVDEMSPATHCGHCGEQLPFCPDCGKRFCDDDCRADHSAYGVCPDTQDDPLDLDETPVEATP